LVIDIGIVLPYERMKLGSIDIAAPFCQAGLAGYSDRAMRLVARRRGCPYAVTEALLDVIMLNGGEGLRRSIDINDEDHPIAGQIIGSEPAEMARAAVILHKAGHDVIDLNFACPVKKIKNKARGGHMLKDVPRARAVMQAVRDALPPAATITVSLRRGFDDSARAVEDFHEIAGAAFSLGYSAIRVHGRSVEQHYLGRSRWAFLKEAKALYPGRTILGAGDVFTAQDAVRLLRETGVDMCWIARGAIGNPWIFKDARVLLASGWQDGLPLPEGVRPPSIHEQRDALREHFAIAMEIHGEQLAGRRMRKTGIKYARFHPLAAQVKADFIAVLSLRDWTSVLEKWYSTEGPGVWPDPSAADEVNEVSCGG
jgi:nifR3 family TIM-barrel protein